MTDPRQDVSATPGNEELIDQLLDEICNRLTQGEPIDLEDYAVRYPQYGERLRRAVPGMNALIELGHGEQSEPSCSLRDLGQLGDYRIIREVGRGGMGVVYEAEQISLGRRVALKVLPFASMLDERVLQRFKNEAQAAALLRHPNIVGIFSVGVERGVHYFSMEMIEGRNLATVVEELRQDAGRDKSKSLDIPRRTSNDDAAARDTEVAARIASSTELSARSAGFCRSIASIGIQAAEAIEYAHSQGIIHRDIKPANLLINEKGHVFITDFGLARIDVNSSLTVTGDLLGTLRYMSPEQARGNQVLDERTDIYSLGLVLYELLTQRPAFDKVDRHELLTQISEYTPPSPRRINVSVPRDLETIVLKATAKHPEARFVSAQDLADDLRRFLENKPVYARRTSRFEVARRLVRRNPIVSTLSLLSIGLLLTAAVAGPWAAVHQQKLTDETKRQNVVLSLSAAYQAWNNGDVRRARTLLTPFIPTNGDTEGLPFPLRHLWGRCQQVREAAIRFSPEHVTSVSLSPDGKNWAVIDSQDSISIWDTSTHHLLKRSRDKKAKGITLLTYSPAGNLLASGSVAGSVHLWDAAELDVVARLNGHSASILSVAFSNNGRYLASASRDGAVRLWNINEGPQVSHSSVLLGQHPFGTGHVVFSPDSRLLVSSGGDKNVKVWDVTTCELLTSWNLDVRGNPYDIPLEFSPDGNLLAVADTRRLTFWEVDTWQRIQSIDLDRHMTLLSFSPDGSRLAAGDFTLIRIYDTTSMRQIDTIDAHATQVIHVEYSPTGDMLSSASADAIKLWPTSRWSNAAESSVALGVSVEFLGQTAESPIIVARGEFENHDWGGDWGLLDRRSGVFHRFVSDGPSFYRAIGSPIDPDLVAVCSFANGTSLIELWNVRLAQPIAKMRGHTNLVWRMAFSPDGKRLATVESDENLQNGAVFLWDVQHRQGRPICKGHAFNDVTFSANGRQIAVARGDWDQGQVDVFDVASERLQFSLSAGRMGSAVRFSPDGRHLATGSWNGLVTVWDLDERQIRFSFQESNKFIGSLVFSPDVRTLAVAGTHMNVSLWDVDSGVRLGALSVTSMPSSLTFSNDGEVLAAGCVDGSVRTWDVFGRRDVIHLDYRPRASIAGD